MNPSDINSSLATLRQLKAMLDAGTLTPQEFEALKQKLVFGSEPTTPSANASATATSLSPSASDAPAAPALSSPVVPATEVELPPASATSEGTDWLAVAAPDLLEDTPTSPLIEAPEEQRNPLTLVFIIGGALVLLALVLYLTLGNSTPDEHLTSTSQTAADSTTVAPEVGPQTEQLTLTPAAPETVRVAPALRPAPAAGATKFSADSAATPTPSAPAKTTPAATPPAAAADSTTKAGQP